jgi:ArsR family transcriptional regulator, arsenate/arsenite/antimonite-responsive transcriptional repressor
VKEASRFFKVLADEARLEMLWLLFNRQELCVCDIMAALQITQSKASRHLAALRNAGLATDRKEGQWSYYSLRPVEDELAKEHLKLLRTNLSKRQDAKQILTKLNAWLKVKQCGDVKFGSRINVTDRKTGFARKRSAGGSR